MRLEPRPLITLGLAAVYMVIVAITWIIVGFDYDAVGDSTSNIVQGIVLPVALASVFMAAATSYLGWWRPAIHEERRAPRWLWAVPVLMFLPGLGSLLGGFGPADRSASYVFWLAIGTLLVGFGEEMLTRGTSLVGLRGGFREPMAWFFSCLLFGLIHSLNLLFGQSLGSTLQQIAIAFVAGSVLDFTTLAFHDAAVDATSLFNGLGILEYVAFTLAIVGVVIVLRRGSEEHATTSDAVTAT